MSNDDPADEDEQVITVEEDGLNVEKRLAPEESDTPAVMFTIESEREGSAYVQITDPLPESIDPDDVGLHPEYDSDGWRRRGGNLQFEGRLDPGASVETVYGLRIAQVDRPSTLLADPQIDELIEAEMVGGASPGPSSDATGSREADSTGDGSADAETTDAETTDAESTGDEPDDGDEDETETEAEDADESTAGLAPTEGETVAAALAAELEAGGVSESTKSTLAEHLQVRLSKSSEIRLDSVQARLSDLEAYTDALETIIDRVGTDEDAISGLSTVRDELDEVHTDLDRTRTTVEELTTQTDDVVAATSDLETRTETIRSDVQSLRSRVDALEELPQAVEALDEELSGVQDEIMVLREDLDAELQEIQSDIEDLQAWRETLARTIAGSGAGGAERGGGHVETSDDDES